MPTPSELPSHVRAIVDEIETEIGDVPGDAERPSRAPAGTRATAGSKPRSTRS
jgi:hypothetical protein